jgi:uncharacterized coiled-coil DUF342 family protein
MNDTYTFKEICKMADVPYSTGRDYKKQYPEWMYCAGTNKRKCYLKETAEVLREISTLKKNGKSAEEVLTHLSQSYPMNTDNVPEKVPTLYEKRQSASKSARSLSSNVPAQLALLTEQQKAITEILQRIADRDERIEQLENDNTKLKRKLFQIEQEMKKPWWKKIFR